MTEKIGVTAFDFYDKKRKNPVDICIKKTKIGHRFNIEKVTYEITKVFKRNAIKCVEVKMIKYKIANTIMTHVHKCPARKGELARMNQDTKNAMIEKYGKKTVEGWEKGRVKMKIAVSTICPDCKVIFWKDKLELSPTVEIVSLKGKKKLKQRK